MRPTISRSAAALLLAVALAAGAEAQSSKTATRCAADNGGITLPAGFCASVFADSLPGPRHLIVAPNGDVIVSLRGAARASGDTVIRIPGGVVVLRDADGDGRAETQKKFGSYVSSEVELRDGYLFTETGTAILRYPWRVGALEPAGDPDTVVSGLPGGGHGNKTFAIGRDGALYVNIGSRTNSCQEKDRSEGSPGIDPCVELETRAGIWRFDSRKLGQKQPDGERFATGIRNAVSMAIYPADGSLYVMQHGRDNLYQNWRAHYDSVRSAENPGEEMFRVTRGADFGWPYCYYDRDLGRKVMAPDYGGDGKSLGRCDGKAGNVAVYPGHWAPNEIMFYQGRTFPAKYRNGAFIAFHGSWNRAPLPQAGYNVVFQPMRQGRADGAYEVFARDFVSPERLAPRSAAPAQRPAVMKQYRPTGLAEGRDGALFITDDQTGRIWKVVYTGSN